MSKTTERRQQLKKALISAAERTIENHGLGGLKARALAYRVGCAVGAIYNVVTDLDDLVFEVNLRTLTALERHLAAAERTVGAVEASTAIDRLVRLATAYLAFAAAHTLRWRALFEHRPPLQKSMPDRYLEEQRKLFRLVEEPLAELQPHLSGVRRALVARSLFSAVHGMVMLGLEEKLQALPLESLHEQIALIVSTIGRGMLAETAGAGG
jgi:AcrR family transcriptional regulator